MSTDADADTFNVSITSKAPEWGKALTAQLNTQLQSINNHLCSVDSKCVNISKQLDEFRTKVQNDIKAVDDKVTEALNTANANKVAIADNVNTIKRLERELVTVNRKCNGLEMLNDRLTAQQEAQESYSRKDNLLIRGIKEQRDETPEMCITAVRNILVRELKLDQDIVNGMVIVRCHRLGSSDIGGNNAAFNRTMIVRFLNYNDRQVVWMKRFDITNRSISISENYANGVEKRRRLLYPVVKKAKSLNNYQRVYLRGDKLTVDNKTYAVNDNIDELPAEIHPRQFSYKSNDNWIVFGGPFSVFNYLSNYYEAPMVYNGIMHNTLEHAYQYAKCDRYDDKAAMNKLLCVKSAAEAKQIGSNIKNFQRADWDSVKTQVMEDLLRIKFSPGSDLGKRLKATTRKSLAEAGRSRSFAIGLSLTNANVFDTTKWSQNGNILGKSLMKIRNELNDP